MKQFLSVVWSKIRPYVINEIVTGLLSIILIICLVLLKCGS